MSVNEYIKEIERRRTFAIISHPDAGKTTLTEQLLRYGGAIRLAGTVKAKKSQRYATSDWMALEKERGISVTSSVMQFPYKDKVINLLDTPGHADFSEDTYRTLTAVDSALMVIDIAKGVEERTIKLMEVCRLRNTPIMTFVNKLDREGRDPIDILDEIEDILEIRCAPMTWPIGMGQTFLGVYRLCDDSVHLFAGRAGIKEDQIFAELESQQAREALGDAAAGLKEELELVRGASWPFDKASYLAGQLTPVFFGSALNCQGTQELMDGFADYAPSPQYRLTESRQVNPDEQKLTGFVFKIQANMDPAHHDRMAFFRITSGRYSKGMKLRHVRARKDFAVHNAQYFMSAKRENAEEAVAGDILGLHNHGAIQIGDTFTEGEELKFVGIPSFAPDLFRRIVINNPMRNKALQKGILQLSEEGATQFFRPLASNDIVLGAVGILQFEVVAYRLKAEYHVDCRFETSTVSTARWLEFQNPGDETEFMHRNEQYLAIDGRECLVYLAPNRANLQLAVQRWPDVKFQSTREL